MIRRGPWQTFQTGKYKGRRVEDIIRDDVYYFMWAVKEFLDVSPDQAALFRRTSGGTIPGYLVKSPPPPRQEPELKGRARNIYERSLDILPNYDDFPDSRPDWWLEFQEQEKGLDIVQRLDLYEDFRRKELRAASDLYL